MNLTELRAAKKEDIILYIKENVEKQPEGIEEMSREDLMVIAIDHKKATEVKIEDTLPTPEQMTDDTTADSAAPDEVTRLMAMGFNSKDEVRQYIKAIAREKEEQKQRLEHLTVLENDMAKRSALMDARDKELNSKGDEIGKKLEEQKELFTRLTELQKKMTPAV